MAMSKGKVSEKMQRAVRKLQSRIGNPNPAQYQNLSLDEASPRSAPRKRSSSLSRDAAAGDDDDDDDDDEGPASPPSDVPEGFLAVYVGRERQRFVISANYLKHHMFKVLLEKSAEEYGFEHKGGLPIACDVAYFENLLWTIKSKNPGSFQLGRLPMILCHRQTDQLKRNLSENEEAAIPNRLLNSAAYIHVCNTFHADFFLFILFSESIFYFQISHPQESHPGAPDASNLLWLQMLHSHRCFTTTW